MENLFHVFPNSPPTTRIERAEQHHLITSDGRKLLDLTAGGTHFAIVGYTNHAVSEAVLRQLTRFGHIDYKLWRNDECDHLAALLLSHARGNFSRVYFCGNSGAEANEAAMKMSYQVHFDRGHRNRKWFISRGQSYHGSTADALAIGERPNLEFYRPMLSPYRALIPEHNVFRQKLTTETIEDYENRSVGQLISKIEELGAENVCAFVAETMMGGLVGDVPPTPGYWRKIREVCDQYGIHLILDEVYCGTGISGKYYCCDYDRVKPDFLTIGKTLAAGFGAISAVLTNDEIYDTVRRGQGRLQHTTTFQANSLAVAAAVEVQKIMVKSETLRCIEDRGDWLRYLLNSKFGELPGFKNVRGRGLRLSLEYDFGPRSNEFGESLTAHMLNHAGILISAKWNRISITPAISVTREEFEEAISELSKSYLQLCDVVSG
jgi:adenosylmethionine-8-amino-7-oxononanoate aminotransferase